MENKPFSVSRTPEDTNFCYYPFMQILVTSEGKYRPCSKHVDHITHNSVVLNTRTATIQQAWDSDYMKEMRRQFLNNEKFPGCGECWRQQSMGLRSMRFDSYQYNVTDKQVMEPKSPIRVELNSSNVCNLKCRICYPTASSKWFVEAQSLYNWKEELHENLKGNNFEIVKSWIENLDEICFFGGEPLRSEDNLELLRFASSKGFSQKISLLFNTNGTIFTDEIESLLAKFKKVRMFFSIDDLHNRFEYQRKGANWDEVLRNIEKAFNFSKSESGRNIEFKICCTVSSMNVFYMPEMFEFFQTNFPGLKIFWNFIFDPWELSIQLLPSSLKEAVEQKLRNKLKVNFKMTESDTRTLDELITFMNHPLDLPFDGFFEYINRHDTFRSESFSKVFPEFWSLIEPFKPSSLEMGKFSKSDQIQIGLISERIPNHKIQLFEKKRLLFKSAFKPQDEKEMTEFMDIAFDAFFELEKVFEDKGQMGQKISLLRDLLYSNKVGKLSILNDLLVFGLYRFYKSISDMTERQIIELFTRKYPKAINESVFEVQTIRS